MPSNRNSNRLVVPGVRKDLNQMKEEIAKEFGVQMRSDKTSQASESAGEEITNRLLQQAYEQMGTQNQE